MFNKTPAEYLKDYENAFKSIPKTEEELKTLVQKSARVFTAEVNNTKEMWGIYEKSLSGDATPNEITKANKQAQELLTSVGFATIMVLPGSFFILPFIIEAAKKFNIDIIPASVKKEFNI